MCTRDIVIVLLTRQKLLVGVFLSLEAHHRELESVRIFSDDLSPFYEILFSTIFFLIDLTFDELTFSVLPSIFSVLLLRDIIFSLDFKPLDIIINL